MNKRFFLYNSDGSIVGEVLGPAVAPGFDNFLEVPETAEYASSYVVEGELRTYTPEQVLARSASPGPGYAWSNATMSWVIATPALIAQRRREFTTAARAELDRPIQVDGRMYDANAASQQAIANAADALRDYPQDSLVWTLADNSRVNVTEADLRAIRRAITLRANRVRQRSAELRAVLDSGDRAAVEALTWDKP